MGLQNFENDSDGEAARLPLTSELTATQEELRRQSQAIDRCQSDAWFLGPKAEQGDLWEGLLTYVFRDYVHWRRNYYPGDPVTISRRQMARQADWVDELHTTLDKVLGELKAHFPFYSPRYVGHMLSEQTLPSVLGYFAAMLYNPNNVTAEAAPVTVALELEAGRKIAEMLGFDPSTSWAHLCSGGTVANLEAFWVARLAQFAPLVARELCREHGWDFPILAAPRGGGVPVQQRLREVDDRELLCLATSESLPVLRRLARWTVQKLGASPEATLTRINEALENSPYSIASQGYASVLAKVGLQPVILVSEAAHYSIAKTAEILGYGNRAIRTVAVDDRFRLSAASLSHNLDSLADHEYPVGMVMIAGTTEEGAFDPIDQAVALRDRLWAQRGVSPWLHVDAAWGGYLCSLLRSSDSRNEQPISHYVSRDLRPSLNDQPLGAPLTLSWDDSEVHAALEAIGSADSVTVDPHKLGYIPYPAGFVVFGSGLVTELIRQKAQYISDDSGGVQDVEQPVEITAVGPYTLEGSRPGAAAASVWLSHKLIPLCREGHGKILKDSLLSARTLAHYLTQHAGWHDTLATTLDLTHDHPPCTFELLCPPDTNVVCFLAFPAARIGGKLVRTDLSLSELNELNQRVYERLSLQHSPTYRGRAHVYSYSQPFFVSRTWISPTQYAVESVSEVLARLNISPAEYAKHGLFVLRSTVMNPLLQRAAEQGKDYLLELLTFLQAVTGDLLRERA